MTWLSTSVPRCTDLRLREGALLNLGHGGVTNSQPRLPGLPAVRQSHIYTLPSTRVLSVHLCSKQPFAEFTQLTAAQPSSCRQPIAGGCFNQIGAPLHKAAVATPPRAPFHHHAEPQPLSQNRPSTTPEYPPITSVRSGSEQATASGRALMEFARLLAPSRSP